MTDLTQSHRAEIFDRANNETLSLPSIDFEVDDYSWGVEGGPKQATLSAKGERNALWNLVATLRNPVRIYWGEQLVWWGLIWGVDVDDAQERAVVDCRGWLDTLEWQYYSRDEGIEEYTRGGRAADLGDHADREAYGQSFQLSSGSGWDVDQIGIRVQKEGSPADNLLVQLRNDSASAPGGTVHASFTILNADIGDTMDWIIQNVSASYTMSTGTTYWLTVERTGAIDASNYFKISINEDLGYSSGNMLIYGGVSWAARDPDADMLFKIIGGEATTDQISDIINTKAQFFTGVFIEDVSGVRTNQFRDGETTALSELLAHLRTGTSNNLRLLARVNNYGGLEVYEEPSRFANDPWLIAGRAKYGVSLDDPFANKIKSAYILAGTRADTDWATDTESTSEYGTKEQIISGREMTEDGANAMVDSHLEFSKYPTPRVSLQNVEIRSDANTVIPLERVDLIYGRWVKLWNVIPSSLDVSTLAQPDYFFIEEAEYSNGELRVTPRGSDGPFSLTLIGGMK